MIRIWAALLALAPIDFGVALAADNLVEACQAVGHQTAIQLEKLGAVTTRKRREVTITMPGGGTMTCYFVSETADVPQVWQITLQGYRQDENLVANSNLEIRNHFAHRR